MYLRFLYGYTEQFSGAKRDGELGGPFCATRSTGINFSCTKVIKSAMVRPGKILIDLIKMARLHEYFNNNN